MAFCACLHRLPRGNAIDVYVVLEQLAREHLCVLVYASLRHSIHGLVAAGRDLSHKSFNTIIFIYVVEESSCRQLKTDRQASDG